MTSRQKVRPQNTDKCIHTASSSGMCQCKVEMEKKFQDFKNLTGDIFKEQLQEQLTEKTKKLRDFSDNLLRENVKLKKDNDKVDALQKLHENVSRQASLHDALIDKFKVDITNLQSTVNGLTEHNQELQSTVDGLQVTVQDVTSRNEELQLTVTELQAVVNEMQNRIKVVEDNIH